MSIFKKELHVDPKYQFLEKYVSIMYRGFWTPAKYEKLINEVDVPHFFNVMSPVDQELIRRCIMAVNLVEDKVKTYWSTLPLDIPQTVVGDVGGLFAMSEVTHRRSYHSLANQLKVDNDNISEHKALLGRIEYLSKYIETDPKVIGKKRVLKKLILFTSLVERCSLFTQFYILMSYAYHNKGLKTISALQESTAIEEDCFIEGTEVMTPKGWVDLRSINEGDLVYGFSEGNLLQETVQRTISKPFKGDLIEVANDRSYTTVTPTHDIIYYTDNKGWCKRKVEDMKFHARTFLPITCNFKHVGVDSLSWEDRLKLAIQADGTLKTWTNTAGDTLLRGVNGGYNYSVTLFKQRKIDRMRLILGNLDIKCKEAVIPETELKKGGIVFSLHLDFGQSYKNFDWVDLTNKSKLWCEDFISELLQWDGYISKDENSYSTGSVENVNLVQIVGTLAGYRTNIYLQKDSLRKETFNDNYKINFYQKDRGVTRSHSYKKTKIPYDGFVYCATVPSGGLVTRNKDKEVFIAGNCHYSFGIDLVNIIKEELPQLWDEYMIELVTDNIKIAYQSELNLIDWFFEKGVPDHLTKEEVVNFLNYNFNVVSKDLGLDLHYKVDQELFEEKSTWFKVKVFMTSEPDFFDNAVSGYASEDEEVNYDELKF